MHAPRLARATLAACALLALACAPRRSVQAELDAYRARRGALVEAETTFTGMRGRYAAYRVRLRSGSGLEVTGRLLRPARDSGDPGPHPAVLLADGRELNSRAVDFLPAEFGDVVVLSLDYPEELPYEIDLAEFVFRGERLRRAARRIPPAFSLGASYLVSRADVDSTRLAVTASSFAVPFAVIAAAADERFRNVALVYGAGDMATVLAANLGVRPRALRRALAWLAMRPYAEFAPERYVARIAPRPLVMVNGEHDPQMPRAAVEALYAAAREPRTLVWLRTGHLMPTDTALIRALVDTALARLPVLHGARSPSTMSRLGSRGARISRRAVPVRARGRSSPLAPPNLTSPRQRLAARHDGGLRHTSEESIHHGRARSRPGGSGARRTRGRHRRGADRRIVERGGRPVGGLRIRGGDPSSRVRALPGTRR